MQGAHLRAPGAVVLSFLWPGLGQAYQGRFRAALIYALPMFGVVLYVVTALVQQGVEGMALDMLDPSHAQTVMVLLGLAGTWHVISMIDAWAFARRGGPPSPVATVLLVALVALAITGYGYTILLAWSFSSAGGQIFVGSTGGDLPLPGLEDPSDAGSLDGSIETASTAPTPGPSPSAAGASDRISILLVGIDRRPGRTHSLTDTLVLATVDPVQGDAALVSIPKDVSRFPLYFGGTYTGAINTLLGYARRHPDEFPDTATSTLMKQVESMLGTPVQYYAAVDLAGFVKLVDLVGGVTVDNPRAIDDPHYGGWTDGRPIGFRLPAGRQDLDAQEAMAFVRSTMGEGDSDFTRARRQQILLLALQAKLVSPEMLPSLPSILAAAGDAVKTNVPATKIGELLDLADTIDDTAVKRVVLGPPYSEAVGTGDNERLRPDLERWRELSVDLFGRDSAFWPASSPSASP
jgi:polyisoprenyl-teichoic acid--peptidoglycan teichoic acid transferase